MSVDPSLCYIHLIFATCCAGVWCPCLQAAAAGNWAGLLSGAPVVAVTGSSTLEAVLEALAVKGLHRVYVVDAEQKPLSIITLTDVLRLVTKA